MILCVSCGEMLTDEEQHYYGTRCERCEAEGCEHLEAWRHGAEDEELDRLYGVPAPVKH